MGTFRVDCTVEDTSQRRKAVVEKMLVDTGSDNTWIPATVLEKLGVKRQKKDLTFVRANGQQITRPVGFVVLRCGEFFTIDEVVFGEPGDLLLLGARTLEGCNARVDSKRKRLVAAGPILAAGNTAKTGCHTDRMNM
jgi:predicted aspartyl protease